MAISSPHNQDWRWKAVSYTHLRRECDARGLSMDIQVDGGINEETAAVVAQNGANVLVAGSAVFKQPDYQKAISAIRESAQQAYPRAK